MRLWRAKSLAQKGRAESHRKTRFEKSVNPINIASMSRFTPLVPGFASALFAFTLWCFPAVAAPAEQPGLPELPQALRELVPSQRNHEGTPAVRLYRKDGLLGIGLSTRKPLTSAQWDAVASLHPRLFSFNDQALSDGDMDRLIALDPVSVSLRITPLTGAGAAKFGAMKNLRSLTSHHLHQPTLEAKEALTRLESLEDFRTAGEFCIEALGAPRLKSVELAEKAATAARVQELVRQPALEMLSLFAHNITTVNDACLADVAKLVSLKTLKIAFAAFTYESGLKHLEALPNLRSLSLYQVDVEAADLQRFQTACPLIKITHTPMNAEYRGKREAMLSREKTPQPK